MSGRGLKIYHVNTRSMYNKLSLLQTLYMNVEILCCTETWLDNRVPDKLVELKGKIIFRCDRHDNVNSYSKKEFGGGVCIYIGTPYMHFAEKVNEHSKVTMDYEIITVTISKPNFRKLLIICVYKPPTGKIDRCINFLKLILANPENTKREIWILGDFNVDILKRNEPNVVLLQGFAKKFGFENLSGLGGWRESSEKVMWDGGAPVSLVLSLSDRWRYAMQFIIAPYLRK